MKDQLKWIPLALLGLSSCGGSVSGTKGGDVEGSGANNTADVGRYVTGTFLTSVDVKYDKMSNVLDETFVASLFNVPGSEISVRDLNSGAEFYWGGKKHVVISTSAPRPFASIYHAEYMFDSLYQPEVLAQRRRNFKGDLTSYGANSGGGLVETPPVRENTYGNGSGGDLGRDSTAANDTSMSIARVTATANQLTEAPKSNFAGVAVAGIGDKAIWDPRQRMLHILYLHHVLHVTVNNNPNPNVDKRQAQLLGLVLLDKLTQEAQGGITTPPPVGYDNSTGMKR
ncbi:hypothetical protein [Tellurirhabdus rosea]|uniref:hypothetical protein n=1 Tax=Tellurirhabdus rosea TaxID=2674997 RepID=UPI002252ACFF|nr:hypothetical protein [Tellurirhabdus rosea]